MENDKWKMDGFLLRYSSPQPQTAEAARAVVFFDQQSNPAKWKTREQQDHKQNPSRR
jgi:hypothetical protein